MKSTTSFIYVLIILLLTICTTTIIHATIHVNLEIPKQGEQYIAIRYRGELNMLTDHTQKDIISYLTMSHSSTDPKFIKSTITFFTSTTKSILFTVELLDGIQLDIRQLLIDSGYEYKKDELIQFHGYMYFTATIQPTTEQLLEYITLFKYSTSTDLSSEVLLTQYSSKTKQDGSWIVSKNVTTSSIYYQREPNDARSTFSILVTNLPFSTKQVTFFPIGHLLLTQKDTTKSIECEINGIDVEMEYNNNKMILNLRPDEPEYAVLYQSDINIICENMSYQELLIGDKYNGIYVEFNDHLKDQPTAIEINTKYMKLGVDVPYVKQDFLMGTLPQPLTNSSIICSYELSFETNDVSAIVLNNDILHLSLEDIPTKPIESYFVLSAAINDESNPDVHRIQLYTTHLTPQQGTESIHSEYTTTLQINETNWKLSNINTTAPLRATYTFVLPSIQTPPPQLIMPQCVLKYTDVGRQIDINQVLMNTIGQPVGPQFNFKTDLLPITQDYNYNRYSIFLDLPLINGVFNHFDLQLSQEDYYFGGKYDCKLTEWSYPHGDSTQKPEIKEYNINGIDRYGKPLIEKKDVAVEVLFKQDFIGGNNYTLDCPNAWLQRDLIHTNTTYNNTLISLYGYTSDKEELDNHIYYLYGSTYLNLAEAPKKDGKSHTLLWIIVFSCIAIAAVLILFGIYARSAHAKKQDHKFFISDEDEHVDSVNYQKQDA